MADDRRTSLFPRTGDHGQVDGCFTSLRYSNDEGFVIGTFEQEGTYQQFAAIGTVIPFRLGMPLRLRGTWEQNPKFGMQFKIETYEQRTPTNTRAIEAYISSGVVPGLGEKTAKLIVARFGENTLKVMENEPQRLLDIPGVGPRLLTSVQEHFGAADAEQEAMAYLMGLGITAKRSAQVWRHVGEETVAKVQSNPYRLIEVPGIGFPLADSIALGLGWETEHPVRIQEGLLHFLSDGCQGGGHAFLKRDLLLSLVAEELGVSYQVAEDALGRLSARGRTVEEGTAVYPRFLHDVEVAIAETAMGGHGIARDRTVFDRELAETEDRLGTVLNEEQRTGVWEACTASLSVLTGGPGTGKTTTLRAVLALCRRYGERVVCASPTGRAAKRMAEVTGETAFTIHRVLGLKPAEEGEDRDGSGFQAKPLPAWDSATFVVIDEASMIDMYLMSHIVGNLGRRRLLLVGDVDQLPSVGPGRILRDFIDSGVGSVTVLTEVFRQAQDSGIVMNAIRINRGEMPELDRYDDFQFVEADASQAAGRVVGGVFRALERRGFDLKRDVQVISPMKKGDAGVFSLNALIQQNLNPRHNEFDPEVERGGMTFRRGDKVMQLKNDTDRDVVNGDVGYVLSVEPYAKRMTVDFGEAGVPKPVEYEFSELTENLLHAFASSVHKTQGSEYPAVVLVLTNAHYAMLQRNLLYTAVTRARSLVCVVGQKSAIAQAVKNEKPVFRNTRLARRLRERVSQA